MFLCTLYFIALTIELTTNIIEQTNITPITAQCTEEISSNQTPIEVENSLLDNNSQETVMPSEDEKTLLPNTSKTITIKNEITPESIDYDYWGKRTPESFTIFINDIEVKQGEAHEIMKKDKEFTVIYSYSFASGIYKGSQEIIYKIDDLADKETLTFSWNETWRVIISNATPIKQKKIKYKQPKKEKKE